MNEVTEIRGITWDHSRAYPPLVAVAQRYEELHPGTRIRWEKRSLHEFGHMPIDLLAERFDLIVIDHPWAGYCFARHLIHDLAELLAPEELEVLSTQFVGPSWESYRYDGKLMALPIDAATPTASWRPDLMQKQGWRPPETWTELVALAEKGGVLMPSFAADLFLNWSMLLVATGANAYMSREYIADVEPALTALRMLKQLAAHMPDGMFGLNPIQLAEHMTTGEATAYCPFAYSYSNYCRPEFTRHPLRYGQLVRLDNGTQLRSIVGGTGLAISQSCQAVPLALDFARYCASRSIQTGLYALSGGQPAHVAAWQDEELDSRCGHFFSGAIHDQGRCILRPRYDGYVPLQEAGGVPIQTYLRGEMPEDKALEAINQAYRNSLGNAAHQPCAG